MEVAKGTELPGPETAALATALEREGASVALAEVVAWISDPHFYRRGRVIALYVGRQPAMLGLLQKVLGQQIAGK